MDYSEPVRRYFEEPGNVGDIAGQNGYCVAASAGRESEGMRIWLAARIEGDKVAEACFRAYGCPYTIAVAAYAAEKMEGCTAERLAFEPLEVGARLALPDEKLACALCAEDALHGLKANWQALRQSQASEQKI